MPTLNLDRLADEGMTFFSFYGQPSCKPGRAACSLAAPPIAARAWELAFKGRPPMTQNANSPRLDRRNWRRAKSIRLRRFVLVSVPRLFLIVLFSFRLRQAADPIDRRAD